MCRVETDEFNFNDRTKLFVPAVPLPIFFLLWPDCFRRRSKNRSFGKESTGKGEAVLANSCSRIGRGNATEFRRVTNFKSDRSVRHVWYITSRVRDTEMIKPDRFYWHRFYPVHSDGSDTLIMCRIISAREIIFISFCRHFTSAWRHEKCISDTRRLRSVTILVFRKKLQNKGLSIMSKVANLY